MITVIPGANDIPGRRHSQGDDIPGQASYEKHSPFEIFYGKGNVVFRFQMKTLWLRNAVKPFPGFHHNVLPDFRRKAGIINASQLEINRSVNESQFKRIAE